jgi:hypothetical protein
MTAPSRNRKDIAWGAALALTAALVSIALFGRPQEVANPVLGAEWQCSHMAFMTSCSRIAPGQPDSRTRSVQFRWV